MKKLTYKKEKKTLIITVPDLHITSPASKDVTEGDTLDINCTSSSYPKATFNLWVHSGPFVSRTFPASSQHESNTLTIRNISYIDTGQYECSANNSEIKEEQKVTDVIVRCE